MDEKPKIIVDNRKARHDYHIIETVEAGIALKGTEVKSLRQGKVNIRDSFARIKYGEVFLHGMHISNYEQGNRFNHDPLRVRKLLLYNGNVKLLGSPGTATRLCPEPLLKKGGKVNPLTKGKQLHDNGDHPQGRGAPHPIPQRRKPTLIFQPHCDILSLMGERLT